MCPSYTMSWLRKRSSGLLSLFSGCRTKSGRFLCDVMLKQIMIGPSSAMLFLRDIVKCFQRNCIPPERTGMWASDEFGSTQARNMPHLQAQMLPLLMQNGQCHLRLAAKTESASEERAFSVAAHKHAHTYSAVIVLFCNTHA